MVECNPLWTLEQSSDNYINLLTDIQYKKVCVIIKVMKCGERIKSAELLVID
jgi:hypothetical protein